MGLVSIRLDRPVPPGGRRLTVAEAEYVRSQGVDCQPYRDERWRIDGHPLLAGRYQLRHLLRRHPREWDLVETLAASRSHTTEIGRALDDLALLHADLLALPDLAHFLMRVRAIHGRLRQVWEGAVETQQAGAASAPGMVTTGTRGAGAAGAPTFVFAERVIRIVRAARPDSCAGCVFEAGASPDLCGAVLQAADAAGVARCTSGPIIYAEARAARPGRGG